MKGLILAGGTGSRLRPITHTKQKQMIPVANKPVMEYAVDDLREAGIDEIGIVLGEQGNEEIKDYFGDGSTFDVEFTYIYQGPPLGLAHAVGCAEDFVGDDAFVVYLGDDMISDGVVEMVNKFDREEYEGVFAVQRVENPSRYGIIETDENSDVTGVQEKPSDPPTNLAGVGVFLLTPEIFNEIKQIKPSWRGELELSDAIDRLLTDGHRLQTHRINGWWRDVGTPEDLIAANYNILDEFSPNRDGTIESGASVVGRVELGGGSVVEEGAEIRGPVAIGSDTIVKSGSHVGPYTSLSDEVTVDGSRIESSVVLSGTKIVGSLHLEDSIIGERSDLQSEHDMRHTEVLIGADSEVRL